MKKIISASFLAAFAVTMLLPVTRQVNAASVNHSVLRQGTTPMPGSGGGGHYQGTTPMPGSGGGGHYQGTTPMPGSGGGGH
jgi:hypothetical protein